MWVLDLGTMVAGCASREGGGIDPAWSEDGALVAYIEPGRDDPLRGRIYVAERSGSGRRPVTAHEDAFEPTWMFGSGRIVYLRHTAEGGGLRHLPEVLAACRAICDEAQRCAGADEFPIFLGGDHSIAIGTVSGMRVLSLTHISAPTRLLSTSYAVFCLKKKTTNTQ